MQLITGFGTNAYIGVAARDVDHLVRLEAEAGVVAMVSVWSCLELLARSAGADSRTVQRAWAAVRKALTHAGYGTPHELRLRVHEAGEVTLAHGNVRKGP